MSIDSMRLSVALLIAFCACGAAAQSNSSSSLGIFENQSDVGSVVPAGSLTYSSGTYTITAAGINLWSNEDGFHFVWKKMSGDLSLTADIDFPDRAGNHSPHRKAVLMVRQTLDKDGAYADVAQHGSGLMGLQYRRAKGGMTQSAEINIDPPKRVRLEKRGDVFTMFVSNHGEPLHQTGASIKLHFDEPFYVGIGLSSHNPAVTEKVVFSNVELKQLTPPATQAQKTLYSALQTMDISSGRDTILASEGGKSMAPNWSRDGKSIYFTHDGHILSIPAAGGAAQPIDVGNLINCSGSHGFSPDGKWYALSCSTADHADRRVYIIPSSGGTPRLVTENTGYFHSWSPDGKTILFTRGAGRGMGNIYSISADGGAETPLTSGTGLSDDPDCSPDGKWIYFNTDRWGGMQIARMYSDGSHVEQVTKDEYKNWTPHPSPDGHSVVFLSYNPDVTTHAANKDIALRILSTSDGKIRTLVNLVGGDGTMNVANWSPDSKSVAFVSYQLLQTDVADSTE